MRFAAKIVGLVLLQGVDWQRVGVVAVGREIGNLTVTVAGDVLNCGIASGQVPYRYPTR